MDKFTPSYINWTIYFIFHEEKWTAAHLCTGGIHSDMDYIFQLMNFFPLFLSALHNLPLILHTIFYLPRLYLE